MPKIGTGEPGKRQVHGRHKWKGKSRSSSNGSNRILASSSSRMFSSRLRASGTCCKARAVRFYCMQDILFQCDSRLLIPAFLLIGAFVQASLDLGASLLALL